MNKLDSFLPFNYTNWNKCNIYKNATLSWAFYTRIKDVVRVCAQINKPKRNLSKIARNCNKQVAKIHNGDIKR